VYARGVRLGLAAAILVGCYAPDVPPGGACTTACPGDQVCDRGMCRAPGDVVPPIDADPDSDADGDGVLASLDNCDAIPNRDQHDEDHDAFGDACDGCPHRVDTGADRDADGVGDACDPNPDVKGDRIAFFDPFTGPRPVWDLTNGWTYANDRLHAEGNGEFAVVELATGNSVLEIAGDVSWEPALPRQLALTFGRPDHFHYCEWYEDSEGAKSALTQAENDVYTSIDDRAFAELVSGGFRLGATERAADKRADCRMTLGPRLDEVGGLTPDAMPGTHVSIDAGRGVFDVDYFIQIVSP
jgi:hypothetical protein